MNILNKNLISLRIRLAAAPIISVLLIFSGCKDASFTGGAKKVSAKTPSRTGDNGKKGDPSQNNDGDNKDGDQDPSGDLDGGSGNRDSSTNPDDLGTDDGHYDPSYGLCTKFQPPGSGVLKMLKVFYEGSECASERNSFVSFVKNPANAAVTKGISGCFFGLGQQHSGGNFKGRWFIAFEEGASVESQMNPGNYKVSSIQSIGTNPNRIAFPLGDACFNAYYR